MKKINVLALLAILLVFFVSSCNTYKSMNTASKVSELKGNPFMYQLSKSVIKNLNTYAGKCGAKSMGKLNLLSTLSSVFTTAEQIGGLKDLLTLTYRITPKKVNAGFDKLSTVKDLIGFIAKNGKGFNFYSTNSSL